MDFKLIRDLKVVTAAGSLSLLLANFSYADHCLHRQPQRPQTSPVCDPGFGYHETCWIRFPALPPCPSSCLDCQAQVLSTGAWPGEIGGGHQGWLVPQPDLNLPYTGQTLSPGLPAGDSASDGRYGILPAPALQSLPAAGPAGHGPVPAGGHAGPATLPGPQSPPGGAARPPIGNPIPTAPIPQPLPPGPAGPPVNPSAWGQPAAFSLPRYQSASRYGGRAITPATQMPAPAMSEPQNRTAVIPAAVSQSPEVFSLLGARRPPAAATGSGPGRNFEPPAESGRYRR